MSMSMFDWMGRRQLCKYDFEFEIMKCLIRGSKCTAADSSVCVVRYVALLFTAMASGSCDFRKSVPAVPLMAPTLPDLPCFVSMETDLPQNLQIQG